MVTVETNISQVMSNLRSKFSGIPDTLEVAVVNPVSYAAAVDQGYTRTVVWAEISRAQIAAIIISMNKRKDSGKKPVWEGEKGFKVTRFEGGFTITVPPAAMTTRSIPDVKKFGKSVWARLPKGFGAASLRAGLMEIAFAAQVILAQNTPVDQGALIKGWDVRSFS